MKVLAVKFMIAPYGSGSALDQYIDTRNASHRATYSDVTMMKNGDCSFKLFKKPGQIFIVPRSNIACWAIEDEAQGQGLGQ